MRTFDFERASSVDDAVRRHATGPGRSWLAGGTMLLDLMKLDVMRPTAVIDVHRLDLDKVEPMPDGRLKIGAMVTNTALARHPIVVKQYPALSHAILLGASTQLRNKATTGGNILQRVRCGYFRDGVSPCNKREPGTGCSAIGGLNRNVHAVLGGSEHCIAVHPSDMCVAVIAIGARVHLQGPKGTRELDFADVHKLPGDTPWIEHALEQDEFLTHLVLDAPIKGAKSAYLKLRDRTSYQFALASCAAIIARRGNTIQSARLALGGVGTKPWRALEAEQYLIGKSTDAATFEQAAAVAMKDARSWGQNGFKIDLGQQAIMRTLQDLAGSAA